MIDENVFIERLAEVLFETNEITLTKGTYFRQHDDWDSLTGMAVQVMIKSNYNVELPVDVFESLNTVGDIYNFVINNASNNE